MELEGRRLALGWAEHAGNGAAAGAPGEQKQPPEPDNPFRIIAVGASQQQFLCRNYLARKGN